MELAVQRRTPGWYNERPRGLPARRAARLIDALAGFTLGLGVREPPRRRDAARSKSGSPPTSPSSTATCSTAGAGTLVDARVVGTFVEGAPVYEDAALDG